MGRQYPFRPFPAGGSFSIPGFPIASSEPHLCLSSASLFCCFFKAFGLAQRPWCRQLEFPDSGNKLFCKWWDWNANCAADSPTLTRMCVWFPNGVV